MVPFCFPTDHSFGWGDGINWFRDRRPDTEHNQRSLPWLHHAHHCTSHQHCDVRRSYTGHGQRKGNKQMQICKKNTCVSWTQTYSTFFSQQVAELDSPAVLMQRPDSLFASLLTAANTVNTWTENTTAPPHSYRCNTIQGSHFTQAFLQQYTIIL